MRSILRHIAILVLAFGLIGYGAKPLPVQAASITLSQPSGTVGTSIAVTGSGFSANETITITYDTTIMASFMATSGSWTYSITVPHSTSGSHTIAASGTLTTTPAIATFTVSPAISSSKTSGPSETSVTVYGTGFGASEIITVTYDGTTVASGISANFQGSWSTSIVVPRSAAGSHTISASGTVNTTPVSVTFTVSPTISVSKTSGASGTSVTITGSGFGASETGITITYDGTTVASVPSANAQGGWTATITVPPSAAGSHTIDAYGATTPATAVADITFTVSLAISASKTSGPSGTSVTITGSGFGASETGITVTYDGTTIASGITANPQGSWTATITIPHSAAGSHVIDAYGATTPVASVPDITFTVSTVISASKTGGPSGTSVTITGSGFGANETGITVTYDGTAIASGITANAQGGWTATVTIPPSAAGSHTIKARGSVTQAESTNEVVFSITPTMSISREFGHVGMAVEVTGSGFAANSSVSFSYDDKEIPTEKATTDASGSFSKSITIPKSSAGAHTIKVTDGQKNSLKVTFTIESTPPPVPIPQAPGDGARIGIIGGATPTFRWSEVKDPSGITYTLQVDTIPDFSQPVLEKTDLTGTRYTVAAAEALPQGTYYWRVKAVNSASVDSAWSQTRLLKSGLMPLSTLLLIIVLAVAALGMGIYFVLVRPRARRREAVAVPEVQMPQVIPGQWRTIEPEEAPREQRQLPWRLALPQPTKGAKALPAEDQARLKVIMEFAQSLPLVEPGYNVNWLVELIENGMGLQMSAPVYEQLLRGEIQVRYEPAWVHHPIYQDLTTLLEGQPVLQDLTAFVDTVNNCASEAVFLLQDIYRDVMAEAPPDFLAKGGWEFIAGIYADAMSWFLGKSLRDPSERDYTIKEEAETRWLCGEDSTSFGGQIVRAADENEALRLRVLHLRLRRAYRNNSRARQIAGMITQLEIQRSRLLNVFSQFGRLKQ